MGLDALMGGAMAGPPLDLGQKEAILAKLGEWDRKYRTEKRLNAVFDTQSEQDEVTGTLLRILRAVVETHFYDAHGYCRAWPCSAVDQMEPCREILAIHLSLGLRKERPPTTTQDHAR